MIVENVSQIIHECLHDANEVGDELHGLKDKMAFGGSAEENEHLLAGSQGEKEV